MFTRSPFFVSFFTSCLDKRGLSVKSRVAKHVASDLALMKDARTRSRAISVLRVLKGKE